MTDFIPLTEAERAKAIAETSGKVGSDAETVLAWDDENNDCVIIESSRGAHIAAVLRRQVGTHIARMFHDGQPSSWAVRVPLKDFRGFGGCFKNRGPKVADPRFAKVAPVADDVDDDEEDDLHEMDAIGFDSDRGCSG